MERLTAMLFRDRAPSLGVTEPGCIALAAAAAYEQVPGSVEKVSVRMTSGLYKNAFTCGIPNTDRTGSVWSAALGVVAGDPDKGLLALESITEQDVREAERLIREEKVEVLLSDVTSDLRLEAEVTTSEGTAVVTILGSHTNIVSIVVNGETVLKEEPEDRTEDEEFDITEETLSSLVRYCETVPFSEIRPLLEAYPMNLALLEAGLASDRTVIGRQLIAMNDGDVYGKDPLKTAHVLTGMAIEARVTGLDRPAMSITGSGSHGILCTMPLYAYGRWAQIWEERLCRATALSYLITMYIKAYSGRLSAFCGCGIAGGTGAACGLCYLMDGDTEAVARTISNMACGITGMICDGGNTGCVLKAVTALDAAWKAAELGKAGITVAPEHGINGRTPEETMRNMGRIADPGMVRTEETIVRIMEEKTEGSV